MEDIKDSFYGKQEDILLYKYNNIIIKIVTTLYSTVFDSLIVIHSYFYSFWTFGCTTCLFENHVNYYLTVVITLISPYCHIHACRIYFFKYFLYDPNPHYASWKEEISEEISEELVDQSQIYQYFSSIVNR